MALKATMNEAQAVTEWLATLEICLQRYGAGSVLWRLSEGLRSKLCKRPVHQPY